MERNNRKRKSRERTGERSTDLIINEVKRTRSKSKEVDGQLSSPSSGEKVNKATNGKKRLCKVKIKSKVVKVKNKKQDVRQIVLRNESEIADDQSDSNNNATIEKQLQERMARENNEDTSEIPSFMGVDIRQIESNERGDNGSKRKIANDGIDIEVEGGDLDLNEDREEDENEIDDQLSVSDDDEVDGLLDYEDDIDQVREGTEDNDNDSEIQFNNKKAATTKKEMMANPELRKLFNMMVEERAQEKVDEMDKEKFKTPTRGLVLSDKTKRQKKNTRDKINIVKSPSDTTIYAPALKLTPEKFQEVGKDRNQRNDNSIEQISNFVDQMRIISAGNGAEGSRQDGRTSPQPGTSRDDRNDEERRNERQDFRNFTTNKLREAGKRADEMVLDAEKYRAIIESRPPGRHYTESSDDDFFHLTCHIDQSVKDKICRGEFVELERLIQKDRFKRPSGGGDKLELVHRDGSTFFQASNMNENKITNVRKWEQAFRIYAAIYSAANPHRSAEIWQYIYVINSAAATYIWENVASYDYTFRQLMSTYPDRNWGKVYLQMWNLTMRDVIPNRSSYQSGNGYRTGGGGYSGGAASANENSAKPDYCWSFNRGRCKWGVKNCKWVNRCSFCDSPTHGVNVCRKKNDNNNKKYEKHGNGREGNGKGYNGSKPSSNSPKKF